MFVPQNVLPLCVFGSPSTHSQDSPQPVHLPPARSYRLLFGALLQPHSTALAILVDNSHHLGHLWVLLPPRPPPTSRQLALGVHSSHDSTAKAPRQFLVAIFAMHTVLGSALWSSTLLSLFVALLRDLPLYLFFFSKELVLIVEGPHLVPLIPWEGVLVVHLPYLYKGPWYTSLWAALRLPDRSPHSGSLLLYLACWLTITHALL